MISGTDYISEILSESYRGNQRTPNPNNPMTKKRRQFANNILRDSGGEPERAFDLSVQQVADNLPTVQTYILSKGETPLSDPIDIARQAYDLRCQEIQKVADAMGVNFGAAQIYIEESESQSAEINSPEADSFLGGLFSAIGNIAGNALQQSAIKRAGEGKKAGILGALTPGYGNLVDYLKAHPEMKGKVTLNEQGDIVPTDLSASNAAILAGGLSKDIFATDAADAVNAQLRKAAIKKNLPFIIGGVVLLLVIIILVVRASNRHK